MKIGLVLGGGGAKGLAHIGVLKVLDREGIKVDLLAGTSAGSMVAAAWSLGITVTELELQAAWLAKPANWHEIVSLGNITKSMIGNTDLLAYLNRLFKSSTFAHLKIPLKVVATDLGSGQEVLLDSGSLAEATMASSSIPGIFPPMFLNGHYLVDGGVSNQTPVSVIESMGADMIIAVDLMRDVDKVVENPSLIDTIMHSYEIMRRQSVRYSLEKANSEYILIEPKFTDIVDTFKFTEFEKFIKAGELAAEKAMPQIKAKLANI